MTGQIGPGWFPNEAMNGVPHWWDGSQWAPTPGTDPRVRLGQMIGDGYTLRWRPPYGWPSPPHAGWFPGPDWTPPPSLPYEPSHQWWRVTNMREYNNPSAVDLVLRTLNLEVRYPDIENTYALVADEIWVAPPNWPAAPRGWTPPPGWAPNPTWGPAPASWPFFQPDPAQVLEQRSLSDGLFQSTPATVQAFLNRIEDYLAWSVAINDALRAAADAFSARGIQGPWTSGLAEFSHKVDDVRQAVSAQRTYVLHALAQAGRFDEHFTTLRSAVAASIRAVILASSDILGSMEGPREEAEPTDGLSDGAELDQNYMPLSHAVMRALSLHLGQFERLNLLDSTGDEGEGAPAAWQAAEEAAASELRSRGFATAQRTPPGADGGFDVEGRGIVAQVKYLAQPVGREVVQRLVGANLHGARMAIFSRSGYTRQAMEFARTAQVALFLVDADDASTESVNEIAQDLYG